MDAKDFRFGFRVIGDCRQPRRLVDADAALAAYAACDDRAELERESYLSAFRFGGDFREHLRATGSTAGFAGPCWAPWASWDIDREGDLPAAIDDARRLVTAIGDGLGVADDDMLCFLSGGKGFHTQVSTALWAPEPGRNFHKFTRRFCESVAGRAGVNIDDGIYDKVRCFRAPNSRHPRTGLHKRRLTVRELMGLNIAGIVELAAEPAPFELPTPTYKSESAAALWAESAERVKHEAEAATARRVNGDGAARLNRSTMAYVRDGAAVGDRHRLLYSASADLAELGAPLQLCSALLTESALDCGLSPSDVKRAIENGWASANAAGEPTEGGVS